MHGAHGSAQCRLERGQHEQSLQAASQFISIRFADELGRPLRRE